MVSATYKRWQDQDPVIPASLVLAAALILPPLQTQAWWLLLPCLICVMLGWRVPALVLMLGASLYADSWVSGIYFLLLLLLLLTRSSVGLDHPLRRAGLSLVQSAPLVILLALLVAGASDRLPDADRSGRAPTGISERMAPGTVSELVADSRLAMQVRFDNDIRLPADQLYWRGLVLENFDGQAWSRAMPPEFVLDADPSPDSIRYQVSLEPHRQIWLFGLHQARTSQAGIYLDNRDVLVALEPVRQRKRYRVYSDLQPESVPVLSDEERRRNLALPPHSNPQTQTWVKALQARYPDAQTLTQALLSHFNQQAFYYTWTPPVTGEHSVDDFLFSTRQGFCEHYAAALAFALRVAGIPARVVAGYQGGRYNALTGHWSVYQYNAHAWVEAWYPQQGWVQLDPTLAIAPERIEGGIDAWLATVPEEQLDARARLRLQLAAIPGISDTLDALEALEYTWDQTMFDDNGDLRTEQVTQWLEQRGLGDAPLWLMALLLLGVGLRAMAGKPAVAAITVAALKPYRQFDRQLRKLGLGRLPGETIDTHLHRVARQCPQQSQDLCRLAQQLSSAVYGQGQMPAPDVYQVLYRAIRTALRT